MDLFVTVCFLFVFAAMIEYAMLNYYSTVSRPPVKTQRMAYSSFTMVTRLVHDAHGQLLGLAGLRRQLPVRVPGRERLPELLLLLRGV
ncbi:hypothetical protein FQN60_006665 [Etheostoma spectabile]|uniref:Neurotransmitter-gated ion-channel transmembrane domain-containing protein n=1 Tax=Etheostoma spectabile TaxID=54343 RepID=A0A5J5CCS5_9PERO|nr:hypothetical protein FQN60_006665 [Etheostoma spectabile]